MTKTLLAAAVITAALAGVARAEPTGPSFNCMDAHSPDEVLICQDENLSAKDRRMASVYSVIINMYRGGYRDYVRRTQAEWRRARRACGYDGNCISQLYDARIAVLGDDFTDDETKGNIAWCRAPSHRRDVDCRCSPDELHCN
jgi:uncharacterized protein